MLIQICDNDYDLQMSFF